MSLPNYAEILPWNGDHVTVTADLNPWNHPGYYFPPAQPSGRWVWIPDQQPGCAACRNGGVCGCVIAPGRITVH